MDRPVPQRLRERVVHETVLVEERQPVEARARDDHLEVVAAAGAVLDAELRRVGKRAAQKRLETLDSHAAMLLTAWPPTSRRRGRKLVRQGAAGVVGAPPGGAPNFVAPTRRTLSRMEVGLFPLGIVLLPTERVPLHIFEPRYQELIGECLETDEEFGLVYADENGVREIGTLARVAEVLERFDDGRLNILVEGGARFRVEQLTRGRSYMTAEVEPVDDEPGEVDGETVARAAGSFRALAALAGAETEDPDEQSPQLSFELAAQVELPPDAKQQLVELRAEQERLELVAELLDDARTALMATRELGERAKRNGSRMSS